MLLYPIHKEDRSYRRQKTKSNVRCILPRDGNRYAISIEVQFKLEIRSDPAGAVPPQFLERSCPTPSLDRRRDALRQQKPPRADIAIAGVDDDLDRLVQQDALDHGHLLNRHSRPMTGGCSRNSRQNPGSKANLPIGEIRGRCHRMSMNPADFNASS